MKFTTTEKISILSHMMRMALIDDDAAMLECAAITKTANIFGISEDEFEKAAYEDFSTSIDRLNDLNSDKKTFILNQLKTVIMADGEIDSREAMLFIVIEKYFGL